MVTRERVILSTHLLTAIGCERKRRNRPNLFSSVEREIISRELADLGTEWCGNDPDRCFGRAASAASRLNAPENEKRRRRA